MHYVQKEKKTDCLCYEIFMLVNQDSRRSSTVTSSDWFLWVEVLKCESKSAFMMHHLKKKKKKADSHFWLCACYTTSLFKSWFCLDAVREAQRDCTLMALNKLINICTLCHFRDKDSLSLTIYVHKPLNYTHTYRMWCKWEQPTSLYVCLECRVIYRSCLTSCTWCITGSVLCFMAISTIFTACKHFPFHVKLSPPDCF